MNINQVYNIVNSVASQMYGEKAPVVTNVTGLISLGDSVTSSDSDKDNFLNTLVDRIGRTIISQRAYSSQVRSLINDSFTFGAIMQKIYVEPLKAVESKQWNLQTGASVDQYIIAKPTVKQKLFKDRDTWSVTITIPDMQLQSAFQSASEMAAFIDAIFLAMRNSMEIFLEGMGNLCYANMICARVIHTRLNNGHTAVNLLAEYNTLKGLSLTTNQAMADTDFLKFASMTINLYVKRMANMSRIFNSENYARFTPPERMRVTMLADFTAACTSYLQANTYHDELVALPKYTEVMYWQGIGDAKSGFEYTGTVNLVTADGYTIKQDHVIAMLSDEEAIGLTYDNRRSKSSYNASGEYTNFFEKADMGYFNDYSENAVIFTVGELAVPTLSKLGTTEYTYSLATGTDQTITATLHGTDSITGITRKGKALVKGTDYTESNGVITLKTAYLATISAGETATFDIELETNAILEFYISVTE